MSTVVAIKGDRRLQSWITSFSTYTKNMGVSPLWQKWAGLCCVSGALGRRVCLNTSRGTLYPNVWCLLVSPPGVGKSILIEEVGNFWAGTPNLNLAPSSTTRAGLIDRLLLTKKVELVNGLPEVNHSLLCASVEFGNLVPVYDNAWLNILNELYDNRKVYEDTTRKLGTISIEHPHLVILAGTQPKYLDNLLPDAAFGMGFTSRFIMAYVGEAQHIKMFAATKKSMDLKGRLQSDLNSIATLRGEYFLSPEAEELYENLYSEGFAPKPTHTKLQHYATRRPAHILKMMMCFAAAESDNFRIMPHHIQQAVDLLLATEKEIPQIFQEMVSKGYADANEEAWSYAMQTWMSNGRKPLLETKMISFLVGKVPNAHIKPTLDTMVQSGYLSVQMTITPSGLPMKSYTPLAKERK